VRIERDTVNTDRKNRIFAGLWRVAVQQQNPIVDLAGKDPVRANRDFAYCHIRWVSPRTIKGTFLSVTNYRYSFLWEEDALGASNEFDAQRFCLTSWQIEPGFVL
jgi:hypothetical protein